MARIFMTGFEDGSANAFTTVGSGYTASTTQKRTGNYALYCPRNENIYSSFTFPTTKTELYLRFAFYPTISTSDAYGPVVTLVDGAGNAMISFFYDRYNARFILYRGLTSAALCASLAGSAPLTTWVVVEAHVLIDNSAGVAELVVNGIAATAFNGDTEEGSTTAINAIRLGNPTGGWFPDKYFDDIAINDTSGTVNNSWVGQGGIRPLLANAAGNHTGLTPSAGSNYQCVDEVPASDADYVSGNTAGAYDLYGVNESVLPASGTVSAVRWIARAKVATDAGNIAPVIRSESTTEQQANIALSTSFAVKDLLMDKDPIDDNPWTLAKVAALEIGVAVN